ncbi:MAG: hypothetical protein ACXVX9_00180 [Mycobacteriaceae bacterium]
MNNEAKSWILLAMAAFTMIASWVTGRHDLATNALILIAIGAIYSTSSKP